MMEQLSIQPVREVSYYPKQSSKNGIGLSWSGLGGRRRRNWRWVVEEGKGGGDCLERGGGKLKRARGREAPWKKDRVKKEIWIGKGGLETELSLVAPSGSLGN